jgi:hypothetical protein
MRTDSFINLRSIALDPTENSCVIYSQSTLSHHLFQVTIAELIPSDAQKNELRLKVTPLEWGLIMFHD